MTELQIGKNYKMSNKFTISFELVNDIVNLFAIRGNTVFFSCNNNSYTCNIALFGNSIVSNTVGSNLQTSVKSIEKPSEPKITKPVEVKPQSPVQQPEQSIKPQSSPAQPASVQPEVKPATTPKPSIKPSTPVPTPKPVSTIPSQDEDNPYGDNL